MHGTPTLQAPRVLLFDWHGTLVDTLDAMFGAVEEFLPELEELGLIDRLLPEERCKTQDDAKLVRYIRVYRHLHPRILAERRLSRTDIFNAVFGTDAEAKRIAHAAYNRCYRNHFGEVRPFQGGVYEYLSAFRQLGIKLGIATNRSREFLEHELAAVDGGRWRELIDVTVCADDVTEYKPSPEVIFAALGALDVEPGPDVWYVGDGYSDMLAARAAGVGALFYNGLHWDREWFARVFGAEAPDAVLESLEGLMDQVQALGEGGYARSPAAVRPPPFPAPELPPPRIEPDWHPALAQLVAPRAVLFDWHATLVDTMDAMYRAVDDMLPEFEQLGLTQRMISAEQSRSPEDARLVEYVRRFAALHPKVKADRKISRTDIFEVLFGNDDEAKRIAHRRFNQHYRRHYGTVLPFEPHVRRMLLALRGLPVQTAVITNRDREFYEHELQAVEAGSWVELFDAHVCGDDTPLRKPHPDQLLLAAERLGVEPGVDVWYVGDSTTDVISAKRAGMTSVFFNGAQWDLPWLQKIFPGTERHPYKPDVVVNDFSEFWALVLTCRERRGSLTLPPPEHSAQ